MVNQLIAPFLPPFIFFRLAKEDAQPPGFIHVARKKVRRLGWRGFACNRRAARPHELDDFLLHVFVERVGVADDFRVLPLQPFKIFGIRQHDLRVAIRVRHDIHADRLAQRM